MKLTIFGALLVGLATVGCGAGSDGTALRKGSDKGGGDGTGSGDPNDPGGGIDILGTGGGGGGVIEGRDECGGDIYQGESSILDMYIMMDRSGSMIGICLVPGVFCLGQDVWVPIGTALGTFVTLPESAGMSAGIQFFPLPLGASDGSQTCDVNMYASPATPIAALPANGAAIQQAIVNHGPEQFGGTPTRPAMEGAMAHARAWAQQNPSHKTIIVLATDGEPNDCNSSVDAVAQIAASGLGGSPRIETYVIGIGNVAGLNQIAQAGGSGQALIVDADPNVASQQFLAAMNQIRGRAIPCDFGIPSAAMGSPELVNIKFTPPGGTETIVPFVNEEARCDPTNGGWFYATDEAGTPTRIITCPSTCNAVSSVDNAQVKVVVGCPQVIE